MCGQPVGASSPARRALRTVQISIAALAVALALPSAAFAAVTVNTTGDAAPSPTECMGARGDCSLRQAVDKASSTDTVRVPANGSHYVVSLGELVVGKNLTIQGAGAGTTTIDAQGHSRVFRIASPASAVTFSGVTVSGGAAGGTGPLFGGGAIYNGAGAALTVNDSVLSNNSATGTGAGGNNGGGAIWTQGDLSVTRTKLIGNTLTLTAVGAKCCQGGGAIYYNGGGTTQSLTDDTLAGNSAHLSGASSDGGVGGGAYFNDGGALSIDGSTLSGNTFSVTGSVADSGGGAVFHDGGGFTVTNSTLANNAATPLAGADNGGGAIFYDGGSATVTGSTIASNATAGAGGAILAGPTVTFRDSIVAGNSAASAPNCAAASSSPFASGGYNLESANTCGLTGTGDRVNTDPHLRRLANNGGSTQTMSLPLSSPAVDHGKSFGLTSDQRGASRPVEFPGIPDASGGDGSDIGAFELHPQDIPNHFGFGRLKRNKRKGSAKLIVILPGPGTLSLGGGGISSKREAVSGGRVRVKLVPRGGLRRRLKRHHRAKVKLSVTFTPAGGVPNTEAKTVKLIRRR